MRTLAILSLIFMFISCNSKVKSNRPSFLIGNWVRINNSPNTTTFENWDNNLNGFGYTIKEKDTTFKEILTIEKVKDTLNLKVTGVNDSPTYFVFTNQTDSSFTCINERNEFPKKIKYWKHKEKLYAKVSNEDIELDFIFERLK
ncbi:hypothetical protein [Tenacibaculum xiamenense]|uniref:hypothetical protein n=1 Tax=Tenacibaculum xiamenense TaxID=1261553 RepID=UPI003893D657